MEEQQQAEEQNLEDEIEKLEEDVELLAQKIADFRQTSRDHLKNTLASILSAQTPPANFTLRLLHHSDPPGPSANPNLGDASTPLAPEGRDKLSVEKDTKQDERERIIKQKNSDNTLAKALLVKKLKDCISRIDKLDSFKQDMIHPAFKRRKQTTGQAEKKFYM